MKQMFKLSAAPAGEVEQAELLTYISLPLTPNKPFHKPPSCRRTMKILRRRTKARVVVGSNAS
ncbi:MAG: hypothetical protein WCO51_13475 [bacterium]